MTDGLLRAIRGREPIERILEWQRRLDRAWGFQRRAARPGIFG